VKGLRKSSCVPSSLGDSFQKGAFFFSSCGTRSAKPSFTRYLVP
jgi:hypothetical protein